MDGNDEDVKQSPKVHEGTGSHQLPHSASGHSLASSSSANPFSAHSDEHILSPEDDIVGTMDRDRRDIYDAGAC